MLLLREDFQERLPRDSCRDLNAALNILNVALGAELISGDNRRLSNNNSMFSGSHSTRNYYALATAVVKKR